MFTPSNEFEFISWSIIRQSFNFDIRYDWLQSLASVKLIVAYKAITQIIMPIFWGGGKSTWIVYLSTPERITSHLRPARRTLRKASGINVVIKNVDTANPKFYVHIYLFF